MSRQADLLADAHRRAQVRLSASVAAQMLAAWALIDILDLDHTVWRWLAVAVPLVAAGRRQSATLAGNYYAANRLAETGEAFTPVVADVIDPTKVSRSLTVTGPVRAKAAVASGQSFAQASETARVASARAAMRHVTDGGRDTVTASVAADRKALGWARSSSSSPCGFCAMLISRGPVYGQRTVGFQSHDGCLCSATAVYDRADWPGRDRYQHFAELWDQSTVGESDPINAFRRAVETT